MDQHPSVNNLYLSERLQKTLAGIGSHTVTTVIAPMGYGKSTALKWWQQQLAARIPHAKIFRQLVAADSRQDFWDGFCRTRRVGSSCVCRARRSACAADVPRQCWKRAANSCACLSLRQQNPHWVHWRGILPRDAFSRNARTCGSKPIPPALCPRWKRRALCG
mgnify:CR=1 FL=1